VTHVEDGASKVHDQARDEAPFLPQSRLVLLAVLVGVVLFTSLGRYRDPIGEKHFPLMEPGAADFSVIFDGTRVFLDGHNPYYYRDHDSMDRWQRVDIIGGRWFRVAYQPSHFLVYIPVALITTNNREAARIVFVITVALYMLLAFQTWRLVLRAADPPDPMRRLSLLLLPLFAFLLLDNTGTALALARCQSDVINAALCWAALASFLKGKRFWPMFLVTSAMAMKGYPVILGAGLFFLGLRRGEWFKVVGGVLAASAFWLLPVLPYLHDGAIAAYSHATGFFTAESLNHSFRNLFFHIAPGLAEPGRNVAFIVTLGATAGCWWHARAALRAKDVRSSTLWLCLFSTAALLTMLGFSTVSFIYNEILILPGLLVLLTMGDTIWRGCGLRPGIRRMAFAAECTAGILMFTDIMPPLTMPLAAVGDALLALLLALAAASRFRNAGA